MSEEKSQLNFLQYITLLGPREAIWQRAMAIEYRIGKDKGLGVEHTREEWDDMLNRMKNRPIKVSKPKMNPLLNFQRSRVNGKLRTGKKRGRF